ncbi:MAG: DUF5667 domain-containing protein [Candidatus Aquicultor sp.]|nr:DUF5667 domain-containing protein [Candidatus Aquicultor sp.]
MKRDIIDVLDECVEAIINNEKTLRECLDAYNEERSALEPLLVSALRLSEAATIEPDYERKRAARERLLAAVEHKAWETGVERQSVPATTRRGAKTPMPRRPFAKLGIVTLVFAMLSSGAIVMAKESLPGTPLYPVKLAVEKARIGVAGSDEKKAALYLDFAAERVDELEALEKDNKNNPALVGAVARNIEAAQTAAGDSAKFKSSMDDLAKKNRVVLEAVLKKVPETAKPAIERALSNIKEVDADDASKHDVKSRNDEKDSGDGEKRDKESNKRDEGRATPESEQPGTKKPKNFKGSTSDNDDGVSGSVQGGSKESSQDTSRTTTRTKAQNRNAPASGEFGGSGAKSGNAGSDGDDIRDDERLDREILSSDNKRKDSCSRCKAAPSARTDDKD